MGAKVTREQAQNGAPIKIISNGFWKVSEKRKWGDVCYIHSEETKALHSRYKHTHIQKKRTIFRVYNNN